jgi:hypothetical protein
MRYGSDAGHDAADFGQNRLQGRQRRAAFGHGDARVID